MVKLRKACLSVAMVAAMFSICDAQAAWNGRQVKSDDFSGAVNIAYPDSDAVIWQTNGCVAITNDVGDNMFGSGYATDSGTKGIYLLEGGMLTVYQDWLLNGAYNQIRQTGGDLHVRTIKVKNGSIPKDFVFGGSGIADLGWYGTSGSNPLFECDATIAFMDNVRFVQPVGVGLIITSSGNHHIWAYNGGTADYILHDGTDYTVGDFFAFNGGTRIYRSSGIDKHLFGNDPQVRLYEKGGGIEVATGDLTINGYDFKTPKNSIKSITLTDEARNNNGAGWDYPPAVEIYDLGGTGANAAVIVDYDYVNRTITNITVLSGGENYTSPKAQFRYVSGDGNRLLGTPLACVTYNPDYGAFTFASTNQLSKIDFQSATNYCSLLVIDMDKDGLVDHGKSSVTGTDANYINSVVVWSGDRWERTPFFHNCTKLIIKSGCLCIPSGFGYNSKATKPFPKCFDIEFYGGHLSGGSFLATNVVVGGTAWLTGHYRDRNLAEYTSSPYWIDFRVMSVDGKASSWSTKTPPTTPGTMTIDVDSPYGPAALKYGTVRFGGDAENPSKIYLKNYESLKHYRGRRVLLDLSETRHMDSSGNTTVPGTFGTPVPVTPDDVKDIGRLKWDDVAKKLYWQPYRGMVLLFR